jgi:hypothetical protein
MSAPNYQRSRRVLQALVQGLDPETRQELPTDTVLNRIDVVRALLTALSALEDMNARALRRALLPESVGKTWTDDEEHQLREEYGQGTPTPDIATRHARTVRAIEARLQRLGLLSAEQRTTSDSFMGGPDSKPPDKPQGAGQIGAHPQE